MSRIAVYGLWHLGSVTAACLAERHDVVGVDDAHEIVTALAEGRPPVNEPGLAELIARHAGKTLRFSVDAPAALADVDIIWIAFDTPVDDDDVADVDFVVRKIEKAVSFARSGCVIAVSSQLPAGTLARVQEFARREFPQKDLAFACVPENLRLGKAIECFVKSDRYIIGTDRPQAGASLEHVLSAYTGTIVHVSIASAEMSKHALNCFLALSVAYSNELARLCERMGADAGEVEQCLKSDARIGKGAYLSPGSAFSGGTLARDATYLGQLALDKHVTMPIISSILESNQAHKFWAVEKLGQVFGPLQNLKVAVLGLTYKPGTDTLRRSLSLEVCAELRRCGAEVRAYDPAVSQLPAGEGDLILAASAEQAMMGCDAVILLTPWPEFKRLRGDLFRAALRTPVVLDPAGFLRAEIGSDAVRYFSVGTSNGGRI